MTPLRLLLVTLCVAFVAPDALADANALNDNLGPRETSLGEAMRADSRGSLSISLNPAGLALSRELVFEGAYSYRNGDGASALSVSACDSTVAVPGCFYYHYFSAEPTIAGMDMVRSAHEFGSVWSRAISPRVTIGVTGKYFKYDSGVTGEDAQKGFSFDAGTTLVATSTLNLAVVGYNITGKDSPQYPRAIATGFMARPSQRLTFAFDALWDLDAPDDQSGGRYGGGAELFFSSADKQAGYPIRVGAVYDSALEATYVTGGVGFLSRKLGFDIAVRKQVKGDRMNGTGDLTIQASLRVFGPRVAPARRPGF